MRHHGTLTGPTRAKPSSAPVSNWSVPVIGAARGTAHVDPDPGSTDTIRSESGWGDADNNRPDTSSAETVSGNEIRPSRYR